jgi:hypothetical protein
MKTEEPGKTNPDNKNVDTSQNEKAKIEKAKLDKARLEKEKEIRSVGVQKGAVTTINIWFSNIDSCRGNYVYAIHARTE